MISFKTARFLTTLGNGGLLASIAALLRWGPAAIPGILFFALLRLFLTLMKCRQCLRPVFRRPGRWGAHWTIGLPKTCPHCGVGLE